MPEHALEISWKPAAGDDFLRGHYSRVHELRFDGGAVVQASASPSVVGAPWSSTGAVDPEEMFVASLSSCHMLWFLDLARHAGVEIRGYSDSPSGKLGRNAEGRIAMLAVTLSPSADCDADGATLEALHHKAHEACFIANLVRTLVTVEPRIGERHLKR